MTALMMFRPRHSTAAWADFINAASGAVRPLAVAAGVLAAAATLPALAQADTSNDPITAALGGLGNGTNGSLTNALAGIGQSICPSLVKPGATLASVASQLGATKGLSPTMAGLVASMAIQMECPGMMTSVANGKMPFPLQVPGANPSLGPAAPGLFSLGR
ncbi:DUF732 domain-containing protein [Mycobacterium ahvazicum]|uniref:DUF732 domain-containing protein n=1 Tax=Mycobacterium ahvazicum TaxID=1964395 RepID=A0A2K4YG50_9MYCO|nr:DUF732 domain-containing protein [Mycobacterium ahvazicum]SOX55762.1 DUF732 domain-containing protein [Mycobacterium ahvazicum]